MINMLGYGQFLPKMVYQSNRISRKSDSSTIIRTSEIPTYEPLRDPILFVSMYDAWVNAVWAWGDCQTVMKNMMKAVKEGG
jgi:hypothetical protein